MRLYLDTFVFMDILSGSEYAGPAKSYIEMMRKGATGVVSSVLFAELSFHLTKRKGKDKAEEVLIYIQSLPNVEIVPVSEEIAKKAGRLRARYAGRIQKKLTYFDCIHLATAVLSQCNKFVTGDRGFSDIKDIEVEVY
ncbi:MAG: PIN domain-containing protein [Candidatus Aenigmarchaeota archaeon]|nr:PIN domain-containing protein [Candidatus Aenigmarchaeota archaeon]